MNEEAILQSVENIREIANDIKKTFEDYRKENSTTMDFLKEQRIRHDERIKTAEAYICTHGKQHDDHKLEHDVLDKKVETSTKAIWLITGIGIALQIAIPILINFL